MSGEDKSKGYWSIEEKTLFLKLVEQYGKDWKIIAPIIKTRSPNQIRSYAQKLILTLSSKVKMNSTTINKYSLEEFFSVNKTSLSNLTNEEFIFLKTFEKSIPWADLKRRKPETKLKLTNFSNNPPQLIKFKNESFKIKASKPTTASSKSSNSVLVNSLLTIQDITKKLDYMSEYIKKHYNNGNVN